MVVAGSDGAVYKNEAHYLLDIPQNGPELHRKELMRYQANHPDISLNQVVPYSPIFRDRKYLHHLNNHDEIAAQQHQAVA